MKGEEGFEHYYQQIFGERWRRIREAMEGQPAYLSLQEGLLRPYFVDAASVAAASALPLSNGDSVLDMCAAPGGKTLVLAQRLFAATLDGELTANERSSQRRARLHKVLEEHLPDHLRKRIRVTGHDATKWGLYEQDAYDAVLCDVPCSSERHLVSSPEHLKRWSPHRIRSLGTQAVAFLAAACDALKPGGYVLYSTCALTDQENDAVVARALKRRSEMRVLALPGCPEGLPMGVPTAYGRHILPDSDGGAGPLYYALLQKGLHSSHQ